jgi:hypothetical protein
MASHIYYEERYKVVQEVLDEYGDLPSRTIARILHTNHTAMFPSIENARTIVRYRRGTAGDRQRKELKDKRYVKKNI